jgi:nickel-type superoxide dismutase maturation protease
MRARGLIWPLLGLLVASVAAQRWFDVIEVRGSSMSPTLLPGDRLLAVRARPLAGTIVLAVDPREPRRELIKRVARIGPSGVELRGDNPDASTDARMFGRVPLAEVEWRVVLRYAPVRRIGLVSRGRSRRGASLPPTC